MSTPLSTREWIQTLARTSSRRTQGELEDLRVREDLARVAHDVLHSGSAKEKVVALRVLAPMTTPEARALARLGLRDSAPEVRVAAARALADTACARLASEQAVPATTTASDTQRITDEADTRVPVTARGATGPTDTRDATTRTSPPAPQSVEPQAAEDWRSLIDALEDSDATAQVAIMDALARIAPAAAGALFLSRFGKASHTERLTALATAQRLQLPSAFALARLALDAPSVDVRTAAVSLLAGQGEASDGLLIRALSDAAPNVQWEALRALSRSERVPTQVFLPLLAATTTRVQEEAIQVLTLRRDARTCEPLMRLLDASEPATRRSAIRAAGHIGCTEARERFLTMLDRHGDEEEQATLITALGRLGGDPAWGALRTALSDPRPGIRRVASSTWAASPSAPPDRIAVLQGRQREDPAPEVRSHITLALTTLDAATARRALRAALTDPAPDVRIVAVQTLARSTDPDALDALRAHRAVEPHPDVLRALDVALEQRLDG
ncbi:HEAT repeat domain-containing protein [Comamonas sp. JC664]|uniref:HEAT repeat domain-containing protein n=1 Tax=Comamonas sp. JC664 TaxID=2801917 RepID=UPI00174A0D5E|nr:HEAT repeat domain-containing protein [Comamonas sp. JC664]MBL0696903.1 HEAT repeat domain-containing protein [Comamonas sp. JC664]GHG81416.1 hypothetical protein GCM10012319_34610 [Comamonas sp. KCTC 72670]